MRSASGWTSSAAKVGTPAPARTNTVRNRTTQPIRNSEEARTYPSARRVAALPGARTPAGGLAASRDPAAASRANPAATTGSASSAGRSLNESGIAAAPTGTASSWPTITPAPHSAAAMANQRYARRSGPV